MYIIIIYFSAQCYRFNSYPPCIHFVIFSSFHLFSLRLHALSKKKNNLCGCMSFSRGTHVQCFLLGVTTFLFFSFFFALLAFYWNKYDNSFLKKHIYTYLHWYYRVLLCCVTLVKNQPPNESRHQDNVQAVPKHLILVLWTYVIRKSCNNKKKNYHEVRKSNEMLARELTLQI